MDPEQFSSMSVRELAHGTVTRLPRPLQPRPQPGKPVTSDNVTPLSSRDPASERDPALEEERRIAVDLVRDIRTGSSRAEAAMIERYSDGLRYLILRRVHDPERAQDLLHDTFCIAIAKLRDTNIEDPPRLAGYLRGIAVRVCCNAGRRQRREPNVADAEIVERMPDHAPRQFEQLSREQTRSAIRALLQSMPVARDRELLTRLYVHDEDKQEICRALQLDSLHFNRVLHRAKKRFRQVLEKTTAANDLSVR